MTKMADNIGQRVLDHLASTGACVMLDDLCETVGGERKQVTKTICRLITSKYVTRKDRGCYQITALGALVRNTGYKSGPQRGHTGKRKPQPSTLRSRIWLCLRREKRINSFDLQVMVCRGREKNPLNAINKYVGALHRAGYLVKMPRRVRGTAPTSNGYAIWMLVRDTGPAAPVLQQPKGGMRDPNTDEFHWFDKVAA